MAAPAHIDVHLQDPAQLFQPTDHFPSNESGLKPDTELFFLRQASQHRRRAPLAIIVHLGASDGSTAANSGSSVELVGRLRSGFAAAAAGARRAIHDHFRTGRRTLLIGLGVLAGCLLLAAQSQNLFGNGVSGSLVKESAIVFGWVAMWRPASLFLYDWVPKGLRFFDLQRLARADVRIAVCNPSQAR